MVAVAGTSGWFRHRLGDFKLDVRWSVGEGEVMVLFGPSGSGKTQTLRAIAGLLRPAEGLIDIGGQLVFSTEGDIWVPPHQRNVGYVPQHYALFPHLTAAQNVAYAIAGERRERSERVASLLDAFQLVGLAARRPGELSSGQQQRVALARALASEPRLLLLDEPFAALDEDLRSDTRGYLKTTLDTLRIPTILVTHDREDAVSLGNKLIALENGHVVFEGYAGAYFPS
jgi:molybdate transport system ATP-binding protein